MNNIKKQLNNINNFKNIIKNSYVKKFHIKWYAPIVYCAFFIFISILVLFLNIYFISGGKYSLSTLNKVLHNWDSQEWLKTSGLSGDQFKEIKKGWYNVFATLVAGIGMTLAAIATQSLTRNPIAEGSTLGLVQAAIFGVVFSLSLGLSSLFMKYLWAIIFSVSASLLLLLFIYASKRKKTGMQKIILAGLAIGIIYKTLTFIFKSGDASLNTVSYSYVLGGAESISGESRAIPEDSLKITLIISSILVFAGLLLSILNIKGMNLLEIGDQRAKNLGSNVFLTRVLNIIVVLLVLPASVIIVGNMAFLGLFAVHASRWFSKSRNYIKVLPFSILIGCLFANIGLQLTEHFPQINSGIWMTFIGAPYLIYIGLKGLK